MKTSALLICLAGIVYPAYLLSAQETDESLSIRESASALISEDAEKSSGQALLDQLELENRLHQARLTKELRQLNTEKQRLELEYALQQQQLSLGLSELDNERRTLETQRALDKAKEAQETHTLLAEINRIKLENEHDQQLRRKALAELNAAKEQLAAKHALELEQRKQELAQLEAEKTRLELGNAVAEQEQKRSEIRIKTEQLEMKMDLALIDKEVKELMLQKTIHETELTRLKADLELRQKREAWRDEVNRDPIYSTEPFQDGILTVSDRRIPLSGPIITGTADHVTRRIHFFNNQSREQPIFLVIDRSPGGSVMEGYRIIKAMEASAAPIHVVVKSFAASMAAVILTLGETSYAYPNAIILHHQPGTYSWGNVTQQKERLETFKEWARRLHTSVAEKMGVSLDEFYDQMYRENSRGDWEEFADVAQTLKWVDHIVVEVREEGVVKRPTDGPPRPWYFYLADGEATQGQPPPTNFHLPRPEPFDFYFIYNRDGRFRWD